LRRIVAEYGPESILPYSYGGTLGALNGASMDRRFFTAWELHNWNAASAPPLAKKA